jgi:predicted nucleic acid-binding protein
MAVERVTCDTNILFYALDTDAGEEHVVASDLLDRALDSDPILLLQSLAELYNAAVKRKTIPLDPVREFIAGNMNALPVVAFDQVICFQQYHCNGSTDCSSGMPF